MEKDLNEIAQTVGAVKFAPIEFASVTRIFWGPLPLCGGIAFRLLEPFFNKCEYYRLYPGHLLLSPGQDNHQLCLLLS